MTDPVFWIWLQDALGVGSIKADRVIRTCSPEAFYKMNDRELAHLGFAPKEIGRIRSAGLNRAQEQLSLAKSLGCAVITPDHPDYPEKLTNIDGMPCVLYVLGSLAGLNSSPVLTLVGTRSSTPEGGQCAQQLAFGLAEAGCTVVSGLAAGIDYASHEGALRAEGRSIGLLACGLLVDYPKVSNTLKRRILNAGGALVTEFPFRAEVLRCNFNIRNRLLSGIADGVVVVQAPEQSGSLNTARHALEQNRDVFAVPGAISDAQMTGCNRLIRDGGKIVLGVSSVLEEYLHKFPDIITPEKLEKLRREEAKPQHLPENQPRRIERPAPLAQSGKPAEPPHERLSEQKLSALKLSETARTVYAALEAEPLDCEQLAKRTALETAALLAALTELEFADLAKPLGGNRFVLHARTV